MNVFSLLFLAQVMCLLTLSRAHSSIPEIIKPGMGVRFQPRGRTLFPTTGYANIMFHIHLPQLQADNMAFCPINQTKETPFLCKSSWPTDILDLAKTVNDLQQKLAKAQQQLPHLWKAFMLKSNQKRGLFNFIGSLSHSLFGTASQDQIDEIYGHMKTLASAIEESSSDDQSTASQLSELANKVGTKIHGVVMAINQSTTAYVRLADSVRDMKTSITSLIHTQMEHYARTNLDKSLNNARHLLITRLIFTEGAILQSQQWSKGLLKLHDGQLPQELLSTADLQEALIKLERWIQDKNQDLQILKDAGHLHLYYKATTTRTIVVGDSLIIIASIPITSGTHVFDTFRVSVFPLPIHSETSKGQAGFTKINNLPNYFAISKDREFYAELSEAEYKECATDNGGFCNHLMLPTPISRATCCAAIMMNFEAKTLHKLCNFQFFGQTIKPAFYSLGKSRYLLLNLSDTIHVNCPGKPLRRLPPAVIQIATIPCSCKLMAGELTSLTLSTACQANISLKIEHPMNFAIFTHFNYSAYLEEPAAESTKTTVPLLPIPDLSKIAELISSMAAQDPQNGLSLKDIAAKSTHADLGLEMMEQGEDINSGKLSWLSWLIVTICVVWAIFVSTGIMYLMYRLHLLRSIILLTSVQSTNAFVISTTHGPTVSAALEEQLLTIMLQSFKWCIVPLALIMMAYRGKKVYKLIKNWWSKCYKRSQAVSPAPLSNGKLEIFMKLSRNGNYVIIYLCSIPFESGQTTITNCPECYQVVSSGKMFPFLHLAWTETLNYNNNAHDHSITLPTRLAISTRTGRIAKRITTDTALAEITYSLLCKTPAGGHYITIPFPTLEGGFNPDSETEQTNGASMQRHMTPPTGTVSIYPRNETTEFNMTGYQAEITSPPGYADMYISTV